MDQQHSFSIYNASAGSGKTYSLVKSYLKTIFSSRQPDYYKFLLAITFTNKAVAEMKERIVSCLKQFSETSINSGIPSMMKDLSDETGISVEEIQKHSRDILHHLLHHYSAFCVETIDGFNHRLIRTFSRDLKIASNFEVSLEAEELLERAVDNLVQRAGTDEGITRMLVNFALSKTDEDKSWDISRDITKASKILFRENDLEQLEELREISLSDFSNMRKRLRTKLNSVTDELNSVASETLGIIESNGLDESHFNRGSYFNYMHKILNGKPLSFGLQWQDLIEERPLYAGKVAKASPEIASLMDSLQADFANAFQKTKNLVFQQKLIKTLLDNLTPLSVINLVHQELELIKEEDNVLPVSEFNQLIHKELKEQPAPYIYERLGERYRHFFIDEFQDTSRLQWDNLIPLIDNALSQEMDGNSGSLLLVGDAKQSIYRWRGGLPEQFIALCNNENPFSIQDKKVTDLKVNWRSHEKLIEFNNSFFTHLSKSFDDPDHAHLYEIGNRQQPTDKAGGYVSLEFFEYNKVEEAIPVYAERTLEIVSDLTSGGYEPSDICILTRKKKEGVELGRILIENGVPVVSSETLLLDHSPEVQFLVNFLNFRVHPESEELKSKLLLYLHKLFHVEIPLPDFLSEFFGTKNREFSAHLKYFGINLDVAYTHTLSLYETCEYVLKSCDMTHKADAYVDGFLNTVFDFELRQGSSGNSFAEFWERKKDKEAISIPEGINAVRLMTIHKSKGLEFPVVIFPFADVDIYKEISPKAWIRSEELAGRNIPLMINFNNDVVHFGDEAEKLYSDRRRQLQLDNLNLLYVTLTRAVEQLFVLTKLSVIPDDGVRKNYGHFFRDFLECVGEWENSKTRYEFGLPMRKLKKNVSTEKEEVRLDFHTELPEQNNIRVAAADASLWLTDQGAAISYGNQFHDLIDKIVHRHQLDEVFDHLDRRQDLNSEEKSILRKMISGVVEHPDLSAYFDPDAQVMTERDIATASGVLLRPDRINFHSEGEVTVIDYKTGGVQENHKAQINAYAEALEDIGYNIREKLIIYVSENKILINKH